MMNQRMHDGRNMLVELPANHCPAPPRQVRRRYAVKIGGMFVQSGPRLLPCAQRFWQGRGRCLQTRKESFQLLWNLSGLNLLVFWNKAEQSGIGLVGCFPDVDFFYQTWIRGNVLP